MYKLFFSLFAVLVLFSCGGSDNDHSRSFNTAIYKVVLEAVGNDYTANAHIMNMDNVSIVNETTGKDLNQNSVDEYFKGKVVYTMSKKVQYISVQSVIISETSASLKMTIYKDGEEIYQNTISVPDSENKSKSLFYTNMKD